MRRCRAELPCFVGSRRHENRAAAGKFWGVLGTRQIPLQMGVTLLAASSCGPACAGVRKSLVSQGFRASKSLPVPVVLGGPFCQEKCAILAALWGFMVSWRHPA